MKRFAATLLVFVVSSPAPAVSPAEKERAAHVLNRLAFGARPGDVDGIAGLGIDRWIEQQLYPERIPDSAVTERLARYHTLSWSTAQIMKEAYGPIVKARRASGNDSSAMRKARGEARRVMGELVSQRIIRAAESERQLNEVMVDFWMNHFNVFAAKGLDRFLLTAFERDTVRLNIWGRFEDLLMATAKSPAMLFYLDNARSVAAPDQRRGRAAMIKRGGLNENYARELMELHTIGVDGGYTQTDVTELARVLTGWSIDRQDAHFVFRRHLHDRGAKSVLGTSFPAGGGIEEGERMIRFLASHPSTARHIASKLSQRLVADEPPPALVDRVARQFLDTGGDLRATVRAVITSPEFNDPKNYRTKVKSPFEYAISAVRATGGTIHDPLPLARELQKMGQPLYLAQAPTGYGDDAASWVNSGALVQRINFAIDLTANRLAGVRVAIPGDPLRLAGVELTPATKRTIADKTTGDDPAVAAGLVIGSPEFQRQ